ncbi:MAG: hypothetical protein ACTHKM_11480 [Tsuneonella sp.]
MARAALAITLAGAALAAELAARTLRLSDYPLFRRDERFGYGFLPGTSGTMRRRWRWRINALGLRLDHDRLPDAGAVVLLGDSTVEDGVRTDQDDTLAARLASRLGADVYPVACPAWSLENQLAYLRAHPALLEAGTLVFVTNTQDLAALNRWETSSAQPLRRPLSHAVYKAMRATHLQRRILFPGLFPPWADESDPAWQASVRALLAQYRGRVIWLFYPLPHELAAGEAPCAALRPLVKGAAETHDIGAVPGWSLACYADEVHPSPLGRALLLEALTTALAAEP